VGSGHGLILRYCSGIYLEGLRKTMTNLSQDSRSLGPRFESVKAGVLTQLLSFRLKYSLLVSPGSCTVIQT
jgi:hypothetical protein